MDDMLNQIMAWMPSVVYCILVYALVLGQRKLVEHVWKGAHQNWYWREAALPAGPFGTGMLMALIFSDWPFPEMFMQSKLMHVAFGTFLGALSGQVYRTFWAFVKKKREEISG